MRQIFRVALLGGALASASACGGSERPPPSQPAQTQQVGAQPARGDQAGTCPMQVPGTHVTAEDIDGGVAMVFTTGGDVAELRARVRLMAQRHDQMSAQAAGTKMKMVPSAATVVDIDGGALLELRPRDPAQLDELRAQATSHAQHMADGQCPMMTPEGAEHAHR